MTRKDWTPFTVYFGGKLYPYRGPWYYPYVVFFITTPLLHLLLLLVGLGSFFHNTAYRADQRMILAFIGLCTPFLILSLPLSPTNDGIRYLIPALPFAVCFMTLGLIRLWNFIAHSGGKSLAKITVRLVLAGASLLLLALDVHSPARQTPYELSYYNGSVGGLAGAHQRGYETTYWWETLNAPALKELNALALDSRVYFPLPPADLFFKDMIEAGRIHFTPTVEPLDMDFMLIFGRPSVEFWEEQTFPVLSKEGKTAVPIWGIKVDSVPLLRLYRIEGRGAS